MKKTFRIILFIIVLPASMMLGATLGGFINDETAKILCASFGIYTMSRYRKFVPKSEKKDKSSEEEIVYGNGTKAIINDKQCNVTIKNYNVYNKRYEAINDEGRLVGYYRIEELEIIQ